MWAARRKLTWIALAIGIAQLPSVVAAVTLQAAADTYLKQSNDANEGTTPTSDVRSKRAPAAAGRSPAVPAR